MSLISILTSILLIAGGYGVGFGLPTKPRHGNTITICHYIVRQSQQGRVTKVLVCD